MRARARARYLARDPDDDPCRPAPRPPVTHAAQRPRCLSPLLAAALLAPAGCAGPLIIPAEAVGIESEDTARVATPGAPSDTVVVIRADVTGSSDPGTAVRPGIQVLLEEGAGALRGRRVGLITNHTGRLPDGTLSIDALHRWDELELAALFAPEHGIRGAAEAGEHVASGTDARTGLPIHSLYGETRTPTPAMLAGLDALLFDIQDIGARFYTYVWTMTLAMEAAGKAGIPFVVLDRPNPIGGTHVQGNGLDYPEQATFVGLYPVPVRHGMTVGEIARWANAEFDLGADLTVVPAAGWRRAQWYDATGLPWLAPSPNMPTLESATHYPGTCLFEGTNLSVGRGTDRAFQQIGASWLDPRGVLAGLSRYELPGVRIEAVRFTPVNPGDGKYGGEEIPGLRLTVTDRATYDPTRTAAALLVEIQRQHGDELTWRASHFDRLVGSSEVRERIAAGAPLAEVTRGWAEESAAFAAAREPYLIYR